MFINNGHAWIDHNLISLKSTLTLTKSFGNFRKQRDSLRKRLHEAYNWLSTLRWEKINSHKHQILKSLNEKLCKIALEVIRLWLKIHFKNIALFPFIQFLIFDVILLVFFLYTFFEPSSESFNSLISVGFFLLFLKRYF